MGVDFRVSEITLTYSICPSWSYSGFMRFRDRLLYGFGMNVHQLYESHSIKLNAAQPLDGPWSKVPQGLYPLINHSDCDGDLSPENCELVADAMEPIVRAWNAGETDEGYDRMMGLRMVSLMRIASQYSKRLEFT